MDYGCEKSLSLWRLTWHNSGAARQATTSEKQRRGVDAEGKRLFLDRSDRSHCYPEPDRGPRGSVRLACRRLHARRLHANDGHCRKHILHHTPNFPQVMCSTYSPWSLGAAASPYVTAVASAGILDRNLATNGGGLGKSGYTFVAARFSSGASPTLELSRSDL
jgi:hypothetical protein